MNLIALNGPAGCGKDTAANLLSPLGYSSYKISSSLKMALAHLIPVMDIEKSKDVELVPGLSVRKALISLSEDWVKPTFGTEWFGKLLANNLPRYGFGCISDSRFLEELEPILLSHQVVLIRLHREGCTFDGDSGSYLYPSNVRCFDISNNGSKEDLLVCLKEVVEGLGWLAA